MENFRFKYQTTPHCPWSQGLTRDDKMLKSMNHFMGKRVVVTVKMDGENTSLYNDYFHARSIDGNHHPSRDWVKAYWGTIKNDIPNYWRVCGENLYAKHSIYYTDLENYFYGFSIWDDKNICLSWDDTLEWFKLLGITSVPVLFDGIYDEKTIKNLWDDKNRESMEGYVLRDANAFAYDAFSDHMAKFVRRDHVQTDDHWMHSEIVPNELRKL